MVSKRYDVVMVSWTNFFRVRTDTVVERRSCWTLLGADYARRFRMRPGLSLFASFDSGYYTRVLYVGETDLHGRLAVPDWYQKLWKPLYWMRNRWDGLRYGLDRDSR